MNEFESVEQLNQVFKHEQFGLPEQISVMGVPYHRSQAIIFPIPEMLEQGKKAFVIYAVDSSAKDSPTWRQFRQMDIEERPLYEWIVLIWAIDRTLSVRPARAVTNTKARAKADLVKANHALKEGENNIIADTVKVGFLQFNKQVPGKVDTGANLSSLHCEEWKVMSNKNMVEFRSGLLSNNVIRTELLDQVAIKTSEGSEYRPVIALNISINGKQLQNCKFNLNDRSSMEDKILVGQNILEQGKFLVDPNKQRDRFEDVDWDALQDMYKDVEVEIIKESTEENNKKTDALYQMMLDSDVTMSDLAHHILIQEK
jgi:hypothetical protein